MQARFQHLCSLGRSGGTTVLTRPPRIRLVAEHHTKAEDIVTKNKMALQFPIYHPSRYTDQSEPVKRPKEFACFSYDKHHKYHPDDSSLKWYYPPTIMGTSLSNGFAEFDKHDDRTDEHIDSLLKTIAVHEQKTGEPIDASIVTWRGMLTKIMAAPYDKEE